MESSISFVAPPTENIKVSPAGISPCTVKIIRKIPPSLPQVILSQTAKDMNPRRLFSIRLFSFPKSYKQRVVCTAPLFVCCSLIQSLTFEIRAPLAEIWHLAAHGGRKHRPIEVFRRLLFMPDERIGRIGQMREHIRLHRMAKERLSGRVDILPSRSCSSVLRLGI